MRSKLSLGVLELDNTAATSYRLLSCGKASVGASAGWRSVNVLPRESTLSTSTSPPRSRASDRDTLRPSPVPGGRVVWT